jgi:hypothetical protein
MTDLIQLAEWNTARHTEIVLRSGIPLFSIELLKTREGIHSLLDSGLISVKCELVLHPELDEQGNRRPYLDRDGNRAYTLDIHRLAQFGFCFGARNSPATRAWSGTNTANYAPVPLHIALWAYGKWDTSYAFQDVILDCLLGMKLVKASDLD